jgi:hypothetical protein
MVDKTWEFEAISVYGCNVKVLDSFHVLRFVCQHFGLEMLGCILAYPEEVS